MNRHALRQTLAAALVVAPAAFAAASAHAAPQVLALFSTDRPVALACEGGTCRAEMPTLCLQPGRRVPRPGRGYRLAEGQEIALVGRGRDGAEMSIPLQHEVTVTAARTHVSVENVDSARADRQTRHRRGGSRHSRGRRRRSGCRPGRHTAADAGRDRMGGRARPGSSRPPSSTASRTGCQRCG